MIVAFPGLFSYLFFFKAVLIFADNHLEFLCVSVLRVASGPRVKLAGCKSALKKKVREKSRE